VADVVFVHRRLCHGHTGLAVARERLYTDCRGSAITGPRVSITRSAYAHEGFLPDARWAGLLAEAAFAYVDHETQQSYDSLI
jgi:hypothetical protein